MLKTAYSQRLFDVVLTKNRKSCNVKKSGLKLFALDRIFCKVLVKKHNENDYNLVIWCIAKDAIVCYNEAIQNRRVRKTIYDLHGRKGVVTMAKNTNTALRNQVIYSIYVRNHSEEGTFRAVEQDLDRIQSLGVDIIWLMPIHPIGVKNKKGELGCPYAIRDYRAINPEYGTVENFRALVDAIHAKGMKCIIDVVYNHTSPDSWLVEHHPEYFYKKDGKMGNKVGDWGDVVDLDYTNLDLWNYQIETLKMWAQMVDGFRCDVAPLVPIDFWMKARAEVAEVNPDCIWLSESVEPSFITFNRAQGFVAHSDCEVYAAFDMLYDYDIFESFKGYVTGQLPLSRYAEAVNQQEYIYPANYVKLRYLENHDQKRAKAWIPDEQNLFNWTAFLYFQKGATLLYAGQETENDHTPSLFDYDRVNWNTGHDLSAYFRTLYSIKKHPLLTDSSYHIAADDANNIAVATHTKGDAKLVGVFSFHSQSAEADVPLEDGVYTNLLDNQQVTVQNGKLHCSGMPIILEKE